MAFSGVSLVATFFRKSHRHFMLVSFSIKPGDKTDKTERPNLLTKQN